MLPSLGQGANAAIEDAVVLAHALTFQSDPDAALRTYEQQRLCRTMALVEGSRSLARVEQATNRAAIAVRNRFIRYASEKQWVERVTKSMIWPGLGDPQRFAPLPRRLSALERWHWTVDHVAPLHIVSRVRISGRIDVTAVRAALDALAHRHPVLRATIRSDGGANPRFIPAPLRPIPLRLVEKGSWLNEIDHELRNRFDLDGPLLRATLITVDTGVRDLVLTSTYSIADCVTVISFTRQVLEFAADASTGWVPERSMTSGAEKLVPEAFRGVRGKGRALARLASDAVRDRRRVPVRLAPEAWVPPRERFSRLAHRSISGAEYDEFTAIGTLAAPTPVLMFCMAFGLSMDYEVFLLSRIVEEYRAHGDTNAAVMYGLQRVGPIVTAAALIMSIVCIAMATSQVSFMKMTGVGLTLAILVDATLIRAVLMPAAMRLLGSANWWAPAPFRALRSRTASLHETNVPAKIPSDV
jgi:MMPL family